MRRSVLGGVLVAALALVAAACPAEEPEAEIPLTPTPAETPSPEDELELELEAEDLAFDAEELNAPPATEVRLEFRNRDSVLHNFALYETRAAREPLFTGDTVQGPANIAYRFVTPEEAGLYHFQCDVHPQMNGAFGVE